MKQWTSWKKQRMKYIYIKTFSDTTTKNKKYEKREKTIVQLLLSVYILTRCLCSWTNVYCKRECNRKSKQTSEIRIPFDLFEGGKAKKTQTHIHTVHSLVWKISIAYHISKDCMASPTYTYKHNWFVSFSTIFIVYNYIEKHQGIMCSGVDAYCSTPNECDLCDFSPVNVKDIYSINEDRIRKYML